MSVIRMLGLQKAGIIFMIVIQSFLYVIPAVGFAFFVCVVLLHYTANML